MEDSELLKILVGKLDQIAIDLARIGARMDEQEKLHHERRLRDLEDTVNKYTGVKALVVWAIPILISIYAALKP